MRATGGLQKDFWVVMADLAQSDGEMARFAVILCSLSEPGLVARFCRMRKVASVCWRGVKPQPTR
jgi:hypothetical protein